MKNFTMVYLALCFPMQVFAGGVLLCDDYGHMCVQPGLGCGLIPPLHGCSQNEAKSFVLQVASRNHESECQDGVVAAQAHADELCQSKAFIHVNSSQCIANAWNPEINVELMNVAYRCSK